MAAADSFDGMMIVILLPLFIVIFVVIISKVSCVMVSKRNAFLCGQLR